MPSQRASPIPFYLFALGVCLLIGLTASWFTHQSLYTWYPLLHKPALTPPNWVFPVVWTILYLIMGISWGMILNKEMPTANKLFASTFFGLQLFFNFLWSFLFFYLQKPLLALIDLSLLWLAIGLTIMIFQMYSRLAGWLLFPYWMWTSYAWLLNFSIWWNN